MRTGQIKKNPIDFVAEQGGSYAFVLGIDLIGLKPIEIYKWFLAALLYGTRISEKIATHTWQVFQKHHVMSPRQVINTGWGGLVALLDEGGYARYDFKTATKLLTVNQALLSDYDGDLNQLHAAANDACDLEQRIMALGKGIGKVTTQIFLREMRGRWCYAKPALSPLAWRAATEIGYLIKNVKNDARALEQLQIIWSDANQTAAKFPDFEAALVRYGLYLRHQDKSDHPNP